jgi:Ca2+-binding RTX toxin-like protein
VAPARRQHERRRGNDTYVVDVAGDVVTELSGGGVDTVETLITYTLGSEVENLLLTGSGTINGTGNALANQISGNGGNNVLDGGLGADTLTGGLGNDTYVVDNIADLVTEASGAGTDTVQSNISMTLAANVENLMLTASAPINGTGNSLANAITGNGAANTLDGGGGADTLTGGLGDDTYIVDSATDVVTELASAGNDTVRAIITWTLGANVEGLVLTGPSNIDGTGNTLANAISGNAGVNRLDGGTGADTLTGGAGNDTFVVDNVGDVVVESAGGGSDSVESNITWALGAEIERLTLTGSNNINATGNTLANALVGNIGANRIDGGLGNDTMTGGTGKRYLRRRCGGRQRGRARERRNRHHRDGIAWTLGARDRKTSFSRAMGQSPARAMRSTT